MAISPDERQRRIARRERFETARQIVGWSLSIVGEKLGIGTKDTGEISTLIRPIYDAELEYIERCAELLKNIPLPRGQMGKRRGRPPIFPKTAILGAIGPRSDRLEAKAEAILTGPEGDDDVTPERIAAALADIYLNAQSVHGATEEEVNGARWAVGELAERLGVVSLVREATAPAPAVSKREPRQPEATQWSPPMPAIPARVPFASG